MIGSRGIPAQYSGVERAIEEVCKRLVNKGYEFSIYGWKGYARVAPSLPSSLKLFYLPTLPLRYLGTPVNTLLSIFHAQMQGVDIIHLHSLSPAFFSFLPRLFGKKCVVTIHALDWKRKKWGWIGKLLLRLGEISAMIFAHRVVVVSRSMKNYYEKNYRREITFIPNGVSIKGNAPSPGELDRLGLTPGAYLLFVGRIVPEKGLHYLIPAFKETNLELDLAIVGKPSFTDSYLGYLKRISPPRVKFLGEVSGEALHALYAYAALFVLPSDVEGCSLSLLEALSWGTPVLTSDIPECREIVRGNGGIFPRGNSKELRKKLETLIKNAGEPDKKKIREEIQKTYSWEKLSSKWEKVYQSLLS
ncbi:MAG: glycosyltransferase family 4 protein [Caldiserica bacterium]|nr:glycosyltransferase family 4 protein [Caldisericota bacterium]